MTLLDIIKEKIETVEMADDKLVKEIATVEKSILKLVLKLLNTFAIRGGKFDKGDGTNSSILLRLSKEIFAVFDRSNYRPKVEKFLLNFDKVDELNAKMHQGLNGIKIGDLGLSTSKREAINALSKNLLSKDVLESNYINKIRRIMYVGITTGAGVKDVEAQLRTLLVGQGRGELTKYVGQIARDSLLQYDGLINQTIADDFEFDAFQIVNSLVKSSRDNCVEMVSGTGKFKDLAVRPGVFLMADIDKIIKKAKGRKGFNPLATKSNYLIIRNGFNCRHQFIAFRLGTEAEGTLKKLIE